MLVLVAEADPSLRRMLLRALSRREISCLCAGSGRRLLALARRRRPDAVLCAAQLTDGDGIEACRALRLDSPGTGFIIMTGNPDEARRAREAGLALVLEKPFTLAELEGMLHRASAGPSRLALGP